MSTERIINGGGKPRSSNVEILRILATFFILFIHANFWSLGAPTIDEVTTNPIEAWSRTLFEAVGIIAVNCFVFISGWFGINFKLKGLVNFLFQCSFFYIGTTIVLIMVGLYDLNRDIIIRMTFADNWYILSYLLLLIFSPVLNAYIKSTSRKSYRLLLLLFWGFILIDGICPAGPFNAGYSPLFFFGLYLLIRYIRIYNPKFTTFPIYVDLLIFVACSILMSLMWCGFRISCFTYLNPLVIVSSIHFSLIFTKFEFKSKIVNWFAASSFAAYLLHTSPCLRDEYQTFFKDLWSTNTIALFWTKVIFVIFTIMIAAIVLDQLRIRLYKGLVKRIDLDRLFENAI